MKELSKEELLKLAENFIKGLPLSTLFDDIPEGLQRELKDFRDAFRGFVPAERFPRAFLFFSGELDWRPKRFLECRKELLDSAKGSPKSLAMLGKGSANSSPYGQKGG